MEWFQERCAGAKRTRKFETKIRRQMRSSAGHRQYRGIRLVNPGRGYDFRAINFRHEHIGNHQVEVPAAEQRQNRPATRGANHMVTFSLQTELNQGLNRAVIIDKQD